MRTQIFDISKPPVLLYDKVAYLVDYKNVELHHQYLQKYYNKQELAWYDNVIMAKIRENKSKKFILYYSSRGFTYDHKLDSALAYNDNYTIYYVTQALITVE